MCTYLFGYKIFKDQVNDQFYFLSYIFEFAQQKYVVFPMKRQHET